MIKVAFVGSLPSSFADRIRSHLTVPCDFVHTDEEKAAEMLQDIEIFHNWAPGRRRQAAPSRPGSGRRTGPDRSRGNTIRGHAIEGPRP